MNSLLATLEVTLGKKKLYQKASTEPLNMGAFRAMMTELEIQEPQEERSRCILGLDGVCLSRVSKGLS